MTEIEKLEARMSQFERALADVGALQRNGRWVLGIAVTAFLAVGAVIASLNIYSIGRIDTVGDRTNDTRSDVGVMKGDISVIKDQLARIEGTVQSTGADVAQLKLASTVIADRLGIDPSRLQLPPQKGVDPQK